MAVGSMRNLGFRPFRCESRRYPIGAKSYRNAAVKAASARCLASHQPGAPIRSCHVRLGVSRYRLGQRRLFFSPYRRTTDDVDIKTCDEFSMTPTVATTAATAGSQSVVSPGTVAGRAAAGEAYRGLRRAPRALRDDTHCLTGYPHTRVKTLVCGKNGFFEPFNELLCA